MKRSIARTAYFGTLFLVAVLVGTLATHFLPSHLGGGVSGGLGAMIVMYAPRWFDRRWPKPKQGWVE